MDLTNITSLEKRTMSKIKWGVIPFAMILYFINMIDRTNISFAALDMNKALGIEAAAFGLLTSAFFVGYFLLEVPSNMLMHRFGAKKWMGRIMITWGLVTCAMFYAQNFTHVYILRFLLGICEAGFFPGMIYYFTFWFPARYRASTVAIFFFAASIAQVFGAPLATQIMTNIHWLAADGWRWVFMIEGLLAVLFGFLCFIFLSNTPKEAKWLSQEEKDWVTKEIEAEDALKTETAHFKFSKVFAYGKVWRLALIYMFIQIVGGTIQFWMPTFVKEFSSAYSVATVGYIMMLPSLVGSVCMILWGRHSDKTNERIKHAAYPMIVAAVGLLMIALSPDVNLKIIGLIINGAGMASLYGPYWAMPTLLLTGEAAAIGVAIINSMSSFGGFSGNMIVGYIKASSFGTSGVLSFQIACALIAFLLTITLKVKKENAVKAGKQSIDT